MDVAEWLRDLGLERYAEAFRANHIDAEVLTKLTAEDLLGLGVTSIGHRRKLLDAIAGLPDPTSPGADRTGGAVPDPGAIAAPRLPEAERRQLTVLFCDLVGSTALTARLDLEDAGALIRAYQAHVTETVRRWGGHIAQYTGDGVLAYFGWPTAHEDDAERAVRAGLELTDTVGKLSIGGQGPPLAVRVGIATGLVMVGELIGEGAAREHALVGETLNLAARLQGIATPGAIVIAEGTRRILGEMFELRQLGPTRFRGFAQPVRGYRVLGERPAGSRFEARRPGRPSPMVGRDQELALVLERWRQAVSGEGRAVLLVGESGIGKSRLVRAVLDALAGGEHTALRYQCSPYHTGTALHPVIEQLERAAGLTHDDPPAQRLAKLEALLAEGTPDLATAVPLIAALLGIPAGERYPLPDLTPRRQKELTLRALVEQLVGLAAQGPVLVVLEDAHWSDPTTQELFGLALDRVAHLPALMVITYRPEFIPPWPGRAHVTALTLGRLERDAAAALVKQVAGGRVLPAAVHAQILAKTDGVPLFVEELTKAVLESGLLEDQSGRLTGALPPLAVPATLQDSLLARLDRLAPVKMVAQIAAVIGREFAYSLLAQVAPLPEAELVRALDQLTGAELVSAPGTALATTYSFKHALVQDAAYQTLLKSRRQQLHARTAQVLEERFPDVAETQPELLARHCTEAGLALPAVDYWRRAGERAAQRYANAEAIGHFRQALRLLADLPAGPERDRTELLLQTGLGVPLIAAKGYSAPEVQQTYARARELCRGFEGAPAPFPVLLGLSLFYLVKSELPVAHGLAGRCLAGAQEARDDDSLLQAYGVAGAAELYLGRLLAARTLLERGLALYRPGRHHEHAVRYGHDPLGTLAFIARTHALLGRPDLAWRRREALLALIREPAVQPNSLAAMHAHLAHLSLVLRDAPAALRHAGAVVAVALEQDLPLWHGLGRTYRGAALVEDALSRGERSQAAEGIADGLKGLAAYRATGAGLDVATCLCWFAAGDIHLGQPAAGLRLLDEARRVIADSGESYFEAELHRLEGEAYLRIAIAEVATAEACFHKAIAVAQAQEARWWELRAATSLARLRAKQGRRTEAHDLLAPVYGWFTEGFATPDLAAARALLAELG